MSDLPAVPKSSSSGESGQSSKRRFSQFDVLLDRQLSLLFAKPSSWLMILGQPVIIGLLIGLAWEGREAISTTYFCMGIAAVWMGCLNACTSIVREREILLRERMFGVAIWADLLSKLAVWSTVGVVQIVLFLIAQLQLGKLPGGIGQLILYGLLLAVTTSSATALGLLISSVVRSVRAAVMTVPIVLIPQVVFCEPILGKDMNSVTDRIEDFTLTKWIYEGLLAIDGKGEGGIVWGDTLISLGALVLGLCLCFAIALIKLSLEDD